MSKNYERRREDERERKDLVTPSWQRRHSHAGGFLKVTVTKKWKGRTILDALKCLKRKVALNATTNVSVAKRDHGTAGAQGHHS